MTGARRLAASRVTATGSLSKVGLGWLGKKAREPYFSGKLGEGHGAHGRVHLGLEAIDPELVEVAQGDMARPAGDKARPVVEGLAAVLGELLHLDENHGLPHVFEGDAAAGGGGFSDAVLEDAAHVERAGVAEGAEEVVEEDLGMAFLVAGNVAAAHAVKAASFSVRSFILEGRGRGRPPD